MADTFKADVERTVQKTLHMGLGEAIQRLLRVELFLQKGIGSVPETLRAERQLIVDALNTHKLDLGFDCNMDGVPDDVSIFARSAETSCCRILPVDSSRSSASRRSSRRGV
jgi:hypothetical protein